MSRCAYRWADDDKPYISDLVLLTVFEQTTSVKSLLHRRTKLRITETISEDFHWQRPPCDDNFRMPIKADAWFSCGLVEPARFFSLKTLSTRTSRWRESHHSKASDEDDSRTRFDRRVTWIRSTSCLPAWEPTGGCRTRLRVLARKGLSSWITWRRLVPGGTRTAKPQRTKAESSVNAASIAARSGTARAENGRLLWVPGGQWRSYASEGDTPPWKSNWRLCWLPKWARGCRSDDHAVPPVARAVHIRVLARSSGWKWSSERQWSNSCRAFSPDTVLRCVGDVLYGWYKARTVEWPEPRKQRGCAQDQGLMVYALIRASPTQKGRITLPGALAPPTRNAVGRERDGKSQ